MRYFVVDAFTDRVFAGNPAGVCIVEGDWLPDATLQKIAEENNLSETAFVRARGDGDYDLRWFTPVAEVDLCGHATLGTAFVIANKVHPDVAQMVFHTLSGPLAVTRQGTRFAMDFPARPPAPIPADEMFGAAFGVRFLEAYKGARDHMLVVENERTVLAMKPRMTLVAAIPNCFGVIVTAKGDRCDFVSRYFAPAVGVDEDPVTGSSHTTLIPYWAEKLGRTEMVAGQLSKRGGTLYCTHAGERVIVAGEAVLYLEGDIRAGL